MSTTTPARPPMNYAAFKELVGDDLLAALSNDKTSAWTWTPRGVQSFEQLVLDMHQWINCLAADIGNQVNSSNPANKLPMEVLSMIFAETVGPYDIEGCIALSDVCRHWRQAIYSNKTFWNTIQLDESEAAANDVDMLIQFQWRLERAEPALLDLDLCFHTGARSARLDEPLREHMHHVRSLVVDVHQSVFQEQWRTAFSMPAPHLSKLSIVAQLPSNWHPSHGRDSLPAVSANMFANDAPRLHDLFLEGVRLPAPTWSPLRSLTSFIYKADYVDVSELARVVLACPSLRTLHFRVFQSLLAGDDARRPSQLAAVPPGPRITSLAIWTWYMDLNILLDFFLNRIHCHDPKHLFRSLQDDGGRSNLRWVTDAICLDGMDELHLSLCDSESKGSLCATARSASGKTRSSWLDNIRPELRALSAFSRTFAFITQLTLPEKMWPGDGFPSIPHLRVLIVVLENPAQAPSYLDAMPGIFFLPLQPGYSWYLPSLCSLHLAYGAAEDDDDPNADSGERCYSDNPLVISAFEVAAFLTWNITTGLRIRLVLENVVLVEPVDTASMRGLNSLIEELVIEPIYSPRSFDIASLL